MTCTTYKGSLTILWEILNLHVSPYLCAIYALVWTLICMIMEFSPTFRADEYWFSYSIFGCYNLGISIIFYITVGLCCSEKFPSRVKRPESRVTGIGASVFFLKLGASLFCIGAIVLWFLEFFLAFAENQRPFICIFRTCLYLIFHCIQLLFIINSQKIEFYCHRLIVYFGLAHTIAVNLWVWLSLCIAKSEIGDDDHIYNVTYDRVMPWVLHPTEQPTVVNIIFKRHENKLRAVKFFGSTAIIFLTGNVEFCLIAVGVLLSLFYTTAWNRQSHHHVKVNYIKFNYNNTGVAIGLTFVLLNLFMLSVFFEKIMRGSNYPHAAGSIIGIFELSYYSISIIACGIVFQCLFSHKSQNENFQTPPQQDAMPHEKALNVIFLLIGVVGEVIYCCLGLLGVIEGSDLPDSKGLVLPTFAVRALEVIIQAVLLFYLLTQVNKIHPCRTIGKQSITFLIGLNLILFGFHTIEGTIHTFGFPTKIDNPTKILLKVSLPLVVFFRFHCSVCFAEIWKIMFHTESETPSSSGTSTPEELLLEAPNVLPSVTSAAVAAIRNSTSSAPGVTPNRYLVNISNLSVNSEQRAPPSRPAPPSSSRLLSSPRDLYSDFPVDLGTDS